MTARFGRYELLRRLGSGGMAEVFLARFVGPEGFEKRLVIKRVLPRLADDRRLLRMFFEEARTHVSLSHGNLVSVFDFGRVGNEYFIAMEHVRGADLDTLLEATRADRERLSPSLCAYVGMEVCRGLAYVHRRGFVHRDVSPRNVLLSVDGEVKLSDFGLVLTSESETPVYGTLAFAAPEQARGDGVDGRSDLFALGVVLAEALTGRRLRDAATQEEALAIARAGAPIVVEGPLAEVVRRATQTAPGDRYATAEEMLVALERAAAGLGEGREEAVRTLAAKVGALVGARGDEEASAPPPPVGVAATEPAGDEGTTTPGRKRARETYFRDHRSEAFVDEVLQEVPAPAPVSRRRRATLLALGVASALATGTIAVTKLTRLSSTTSQPPAPTPTPTPTPTPAPVPVPVPVPDPTPITVAPPTPIPAPHPQPTRPASPKPTPAAAGTVIIQCTPWCVPYVDQVARGQDGRHHSLSLSAGRHVIQARRLDDRQNRTVEIRPGRSETVDFKFD